ncbi:hypothetical protein R5R35_010239 [Gryllus longicercus]|uniref:CTCK domain-containing protein n=2 Tax=Gryllus longicercus TaxID=2509291 RepID=A0AAN9VC64_9ORTH
MMETSFIFWIMLLLSLNQVHTTHREHKVHNIVLYPDKHSWCKITPIKQVVTYPGCNSVEIDNNVCVGTCFSYSIPRTLPSAPGELIKPYCDSCQPSVLIWKNLTLTCKGEDPDASEMQKSVQIISNCSCSTCDFGEENNGLSSFVSSGDGDVGQRQLDGQELMDWMMESPSAAKLGRKMFNTSMISHANFSASDPVMNEKLLILVKQLAGSGEYSEEEAADRDPSEWDGGDNQEARLDRVALKELLREVEGVDHKVNRETLADFVKHVEERENIKVDLDRLRQVLAHMQHELQQEQQSKSHKIEVEDKNTEPEYQQQNLPSSQQQQQQQQQQHTQHHPHHGEHHSQHHNTQHSHQHSHQHLQHQPLVADRRVERLRDVLNGEPGGERLDVEPHQLKPALEGGELSYHDNLVSANENENDSNKQEEF